jgi:flagellar biosynthetic protein FliQ
VPVNDTAVLDIAAQALTISAKLAVPILVVSLVVGTIISLLQAVTQVQEMTLTFVPKVLAIAAVLMVSGGWMLNELVEFTRGLYELAPTLLR